MPVHIWQKCPNVYVVNAANMRQDFVFVWNTRRNIFVNVSRGETAGTQFRKWLRLPIRGQVVVLSVWMQTVAVRTADSGFGPWWKRFLPPPPPAARSDWSKIFTLKRNRKEWLSPWSERVNLYNRQIKIPSEKVNLYRLPPPSPPRLVRQWFRLAY
jgi:hypothetical protein